MDFVALHLLALLITVPVISHADFMGLQYFRGTVQVLPAITVKWTHRLVFIGLFLLIVTGIVVTVPSWEVWFTKPMFYIKLAFVATLFLNGLFIDKLMLTATQQPYALLSKSEQNTLKTSGALSGMGWVATVLIGLFFL